LQPRGTSSTPGTVGETAGHTSRREAHHGGANRHLICVCAAIVSAGCSNGDSTSPTDETVARTLHEELSYDGRCRSCATDSACNAIDSKCYRVPGLPGASCGSRLRPDPSWSPVESCETDAECPRAGTFCDLNACVYAREGSLYGLPGCERQRARQHESNPARNGESRVRPRGRSALRTLLRGLQVYSCPAISGRYGGAGVVRGVFRNRAGVTSSHSATG
jgi:hypothetical protein